MKKKFIIAAVAMTMTALFMTGCNDGAQNDIIKIDKYKNVEVAKVVKNEVTDQDVESDIQAHLEESATFQEVKTPAKEGDTVNIDYAGKLDGKAFEGGTATGEEVEIGSGTFIPANGEYKSFEEQMIGHKAGDKFEIKVKFPKDYSEELGDKVATFDIKMNAVKIKQIPTLTDDWVKNNSKTSKTVEEYKAEIKKELEEQEEYSYKSMLSSEVLEALLKKAEWVNKPEDKIEAAYEETMKQYEEYAKSANITLGEFIEQYMGSSEEVFTAQIKKEAEESIKQTELIALIAEKENIKLTDEEYTKQATKLAKDYGYEDLKAFETQYTKKTIEEYLVQEKVLEVLVKNCKQVEKTEESTETNGQNVQGATEENQNAQDATAVEGSSENAQKATEANSQNVQESTDSKDQNVQTPADEGAKTDTPDAETGAKESTPASTTSQAK